MSLLSMAAFDSFLGEIHGLEKFGRILGKLTILQVKLTGLSWFIMVYHHSPQNPTAYHHFPPWFLARKAGNAKNSAHLVLPAHRQWQVKSLEMCSSPRLSVSRRNFCYDDFGGPWQGGWWAVIITMAVMTAMIMKIMKIMRLGRIRRRVRPRKNNQSDR